MLLGSLLLGLLFGALAGAVAHLVFGVGWGTSLLVLVVVANLGALLAMLWAGRRR